MHHLLLLPILLKSQLLASRSISIPLVFIPWGRMVATNLITMRALQWITLDRPALFKCLLFPQLLLPQCLFRLPPLLNPKWATFFVSATLILQTGFHKSHKASALEVLALHPICLIIAPTSLQHLEVLPCLYMLVRIVQWLLVDAQVSLEQAV